jgi:uncharacterized protein
MPDFDPDAQLDTSQVEDARGRGGGFGRMGGIGIPGGGATVGGGIIGLIIMVALALFGGGVIDTGGGATPYGRLDNQELDGGGGAGSLAERCRTGADAERYEDCRAVLYVNSIQQYWQSEFARRGGRYQPARTQFFRGSTQSACGPATSAVGPFYCPADQKVYMDLGFLDELQSRFKLRVGDFTPAYILAHEYGHHIQNLIGTLDQAQRDRQGADSGAVRVELQADCLAGVWANNATATGYIRNLSDEDIRIALEAAAAVGDDRIQQAAGQRPDPHKFTHGTSEQRQRWFRRGYQTGDLSACDTFSGGI